MSAKSTVELFKEAKTNWLKDCEICNAGLCATIDSLQQKTGYQWGWDVDIKDLSETSDEANAEVTESA